MEEKLREFRNRRRREQLWETLTFKKVMDRWNSESPPSPVSTAPEPPVTPSPDTPAAPRKADHTSHHHDQSNVSIAAGNEAATTPLHRTLSNASIASSNASMEFSDTPMTRLTLATYILHTLLWATCWLIAIQLQFGAVYLVISGLLAIYFNTRTGPKKPGEMSAYSVFNPNCEAIDGTLKPEQFEKEFNLIHHSPS